MKKFLFFILVGTSVFFLTFLFKEKFVGKPMSSPAHKIPVASSVVQNVDQEKLKENTVGAVAPKTKEKREAKETPNVPLVHYTEGKRSPNTLLSSEVVKWTNTYREQNQLRTLARNQQLDAAAIIKVHDMFDRQYFEHISPSGKKPADIVSGVGYEYLRVGENLALGIFSNEKELTDAWMASPGHRANILNSHFEEIGVAVEEGVFNGEHVWLAVQEFGTPSSSCPAPKTGMKDEIENDRAQIEKFSADASRLVFEMEKRKSENDMNAYNQKVSEYNALIGVLNPLVEKTKSLIVVYNAEINAYNACIGN